MSAHSEPRRTGRPRLSRRDVALFAALLTFTAVLSAGAVIAATRWATQPGTPNTSLDAGAVTAQTSAGQTSAGQTSAGQSSGASPIAAASTSTIAGGTPVATRLVVGATPTRLLDPQRTGLLAPGTTVDVPLPTLPTGTTAVLLELSMTDATGPGPVVFRSGADQVPAVTLRAVHASTSATVVVLVGPDRALSVHTDGGGTLSVDLIGSFEPATSATSGRVVAVPATPVLRLKPAADGNDVELTLDTMPVPAQAGAVSAVLLHVAGDVGQHGGYVAVGPSAPTLNQRVDWGATTGTDRTRDGFLAVPVTDRRFHLRYHAGTELRVDLIGYVTGDRAESSAAGLLVPVAYQDGQAVRVTAGGPADVAVVPSTGLVGVAPRRVSAALLTVSASAATPAGVVLRAAAGAASGTDSGTGAASAPTLSTGDKPRSTLTAVAVTDGRVNVSSPAGAAVIVTPRVLVLAG